MASASEFKGASNNERLLAAARQDDEALLLEVFDEGNFDINFQDGLGNTALHYAVAQGSTDTLEHILSHEDCDVDPINYIEKATPLHLAMKIEDAELRLYIVNSLLDAGANMKIKDRHGETAIDLMPYKDEKLRAAVRKSQALASMSNGDIASDDDGEAGSGSDE